MSEYLKSNTVDKKSVYLAVGFLSGVGILISTTMPMVIGTMISTFGFSESQIGDLVALFSLTFTLVAIASLFFVRLINWKLLAAITTLLCIATLFAVTLTDSYAVLITLFALMGVGMGGIYSLGMTILGDSENPDKAFGLKLGFESFPAVLALFILPVFVIPAYGFKGMMYAMAAMSLIILPLCCFIPSRGVKTTKRSGADVNVQAENAAINPRSGPPAVALSLITLVGSIIFFSGVIATWAFLEVMGTIKSLPTESVGSILALGMLSATIGAFFAGNRKGRNVPMMAIIIFNLLSLIVIWKSTTLLSFGAGAILFTFCINYALAYFFGLSAEVDLSGRFVALGATTLSLGGVIGPAVAGRLMEANGFEAVLVFSAICAVLSLAIYVLVVRKAQLSIKGLNL